MKYSENIRQVEALDPNYMGFIFYQKSPRYVGETLDRDLLIDLSSSIKKVGVFVDHDLDKIQHLAEYYQLDLIQLHGMETPERCREIKERGLGVIKAFRLNDQCDFTKLTSYASWVDYFLFDSPGEYYGGNGKAFDWDLLKDYNLEVPFFLSGGIDKELLAEVKQLSKHTLHALDVNSKFETMPGLKDVIKLEELSKLIRSNFKNG